jgi:integrase
MPKLTATTVDRFKPGASRREIPDAHLTGLYLIIQPSDARSWAVRYRNAAGRSRKLTLGAWPALDLAAARRKAQQALRAASEGKDPAAEKRAERREAPARSFAKVAETFLARHAKKNRSYDESKRILDVYVLPRWRDLQIADIDRLQVTELLDDIEAGRLSVKRVSDDPVRYVEAAGGEKLGGPVMADRVLACVRKLFNWHATRDHRFSSPIVKGMARTKPKERARDRTLSDDEVRALWAAWTADDSMFGPLAKLILLTAARRDEIAGMLKGEITQVDHNGRRYTVWTVPASRYKNKQPHVVPLTAPALEIIEARPAIGKAGLLFTTTGDTAFSGFSKAKVNCCKAAGVHGWTLHDLRRTATTLMTRSGVSHFIADRVLGHVIPGVGGLYDRHTYLPEKAHALETLAAAVDRIVTGKADDKVVHFRERLQR